MSSTRSRVAILLPGLAALTCGACLNSGDAPAVDSILGSRPSDGPEGGASVPDGPSPEDAGNDSASPSTLDATRGAVRGPSGSDATLPAHDASLEADPATIDGASSKDGATPDKFTDGGGEEPYKGVAGSNCAELVSLRVAWWYDWGLDPTGCTSPPFVPMVWGAETPAAIASAVSAGATAGHRYVLGFNEPDNASQSNISVATAISLWPSFDNPSVAIGSPATQGNATGLAWIQNFMTQINADTTGKLRVDFIATHWYGWNAGACDPAANSLQAWIEGIEAIPGNRPIWLTEWGCLNESNPNAATVQAFYAGALAMFAKHPRVVRYAWYQWETYNELVDADGGALTTLGIAYASAPDYR